MNRGPSGDGVPPELQKQHRAEQTESLGHAKADPGHHDLSKQGELEPWGSPSLSGRIRFKTVGTQIFAGFRGSVRAGSTSPAAILEKKRI